MKQYDALSLLSGGLDSILAAKAVARQGLSVLGLHFVSPFFGKPGSVAAWRAKYGLDIETVDVADAFVAMMAGGPANGVGKFLNPCIDCKIFMLRRAKDMLEKYGARFLVTGEVIGQRPMSQRIDALNIISRDAGVRSILLRPLSAKRLPPSPMEESGLVRREELYGFYGRGRREQLDLAASFGLTDLPTPGGGCMLAELESARRYYPIFRHKRLPSGADLHLANVGRQYWRSGLALAVGRNQSDNARLEALASEGDLLFKVRDYPGPLGLGRRFGQTPWDEAEVRFAAALLASYSGKAVALGGPVEVTVGLGGARVSVAVTPCRDAPNGFAEPDWETAKQGKRALFGDEREDDF
ncbi:MAG: tRNA(5-methylaminomethyl-2-thiouridylate) methyltransferase [Desulfovibrionaceae bacterium]|nr:tRNA(5-methylaminomethyl-2-thiouridylate) methyltransferase [Desulfovibrionaceae bacterium]